MDHSSTQYGPLGLDPGEEAMETLPLNPLQVPLKSPNTIGIDYSENPSYHDENDDNLPLSQAIKKYPKIVAYCLSMTVSIVGWGYDLVIVGSVTAVAAFQEGYGQMYDGRMIIPKWWLTMWMTFGPLGSAVGSIMGGWIQDRIGRKYSLMVGSVISAMAVAVIVCSNLPTNIDGRRIAFTVGKTVQGFSIGIIKVTAMTYVSETCPTSLRAPAMALFPTFTLLGQLIGSGVVLAINGVKSDKGYIGAFASQWLLSLAPFILAVIMPDSPTYLVRKGKQEKAAKAAERLFSPRVNAFKELEKLRINFEKEQAISSGATYRACLTRANFRRTWIVILANLLPAMFGLSLLSNSSYFLQQVGMDNGTSLIILVIGIFIGIIGNACSIWLLSKVSRRPATIVSIAIAGLLWFGVGIASFWNGEKAAYAVAIIMVVIILICGVGCWPAGYAIMGETSSLALRSKTSAIGTVAQQVSSIAMNMTLPALYNPDAANLGAKTGYLFAALSVIALVASWLSLPEMKGRSVEEIDHMFTIGLPTRQFRHWSSSLPL